MKTKGLLDIQLRSSKAPWTEVTSRLCAFPVVYMSTLAPAGDVVSTAAMSPTAMVSGASSVRAEGACGIDDILTCMHTAVSKPGRRIGHEGEEEGED